MKRLGIAGLAGALAAVLATVAGCQKRPEDVVKSWRKLDLNGVPVVPNEDVAFLRERLPGAIAALKMGLADGDAKVRFCAAYAIWQLGPAVAELAPDLRTAFGNEIDPSTRRAMTDAAVAIGYSSEAMLLALREAYTRTKDDPLTKSGLACALVKLSSPAGEPDAWAWLLRALGPGSELDDLPYRYPMIARYRIAKTIQGLPNPPPEGLKAVEALRADPEMRDMLDGRPRLLSAYGSRPTSRPR